jgi:hypothetical protein
MTTNELKQYQHELKTILSGPAITGDKSSDVRLKELAQRVGVCCIMSGGDNARPYELAQLIHQALQTASMISMAETAARNYWIALVASLIALLSAAAAWVAVFVQIVGNMKQLYL